MKPTRRNLHVVASSKVARRCIVGVYGIRRAATEYVQATIRVGEAGRGDN